MENEELKKGDDIISKEREMKKIELLRKLADILLRMKHHGTHAEIESELSQTLAQLLDPEGSFIQRQFPTSDYSHH